LERYQAIVVGSGPNGFAAAITCQQQGLKTLLIEGGDTIGGGMRTKELTLAGFQHDVCSAVHPMALASPFFASLPLADFGLQFAHAKYEAAHPLEGSEDVFLQRDIQATAQALGADRQAYLDLIQPVADKWPELAQGTMGPFRLPKHPITLANFGLKALCSAEHIAKRFHTTGAKALWAGMAAHGIQPLRNWTTAACCVRRS